MARCDGRVARSTRPLACSTRVDGFIYSFILYFSTICIHARRFSTGRWSCITRGARETQVAQEAHKERGTRLTRVVDLETMRL